MSTPVDIYNMPSDVFEALVGPIIDELPTRSVADLVQDEVVTAQLRRLHQAGYTITAIDGTPVADERLDNEVVVDGEVYQVEIPKLGKRSWTRVEASNGCRLWFLPVMLTKTDLP